MRILALTFLFLLSACGQTGKLYLPEENEPVKKEVVESKEPASQKAAEETPRRPERKRTIQRKN